MRNTIMKRYETDSSRRMLLEQIRGALDAMPGAVRQTFVLGHYAGLSIAEISQAQTIQKRDVVRRLKQADAILHRHVSEKVRRINAA